jgi:murein DD-endopeptidase MepM/ murein hydrolase activator NlpD
MVRAEQRLLYVHALPSRPLARRAARSALVAAVAVVPTIGVLAASGAPGFPALASSREKVIPMTYDRADVAAWQARLAAADRARMAAWYQAVGSYETTLDRQRASRGEPRQVLGARLHAGQYWRPTTGTLTQPFHPGHKGIDIGVPLGTPVVSAADGTVTFAGQQTGYGTHVEVQHADGVVTTYSHLSHIDVVVGQKVRAGQLIAHSGNTGHSTGPHLHFEVHPTPGTLTDPITWLRAHGAW